METEVNGVFVAAHELKSPLVLLRQLALSLDSSDIKSLEKTASAAIIKNYFGTPDITSSDISQGEREPVDFITGFDYISHFDYSTRRALYEKAKRMLKPGGLFLFSAREPVTGIKMRAVEGWEKYPVYEAMWTSKQLIAELEDNGFQIRFLIPTGTGLYDVLPAKYKNIPSLYIVGAVPLR
jgi:cyclopropane fatty-acyl-phospholipid synthase-like methyltransferase